MGGDSVVDNSEAFQLTSAAGVPGCKKNLASKLDSLEFRKRSLEGVLSEELVDIAAPNSVHHSTPCISSLLPPPISPSLPEQMIFAEPPNVAMEADMHSASYSQPPPRTFYREEAVVETPDLYAQVTGMLETLQLKEILPKFKSSLIKVSKL